MIRRSRHTPPERLLRSGNSLFPLFFLLILISCQFGNNGKSLVWQDVCWPLYTDDIEITGEDGLAEYEPYKMIGQTYVPFTRLIRSNEKDVFIGLCYTKDLKSLVSDQNAESVLNSKKSIVHEMQVAEYLIAVNGTKCYRVFYQAADGSVLVFTVVDKMDPENSEIRYSDPDFLKDKFLCAS